MPGAEPVTLHRWLAEAAHRHGDQTAVIAEGDSITIGELWARAGAVAGALVRIGVLPGDRVALVAEKSIDAITALFGALVAGAVYVPLAPHWPRGRLDAALNHCDARVVIACNDVGSPGPVIVDQRSGRSVSWPDALRCSPDLAGGAEIDPADPACILYTSGSTGLPKGVTISHRAVGVFVNWTAEAFGIGPDDRLLCPAPLGFDLSTLDVFNIARSGSTCVVVPETALWIPRFLLRSARELAVTVWYSVPSILSRMLDDGGLEREPLESLRTLLFAGEVMPAPVAARLRRTQPRAELCNLYGPTETNVVTWFRLPDEVDPERPIPIGCPCPYARVRLEPVGAIPSERGETGHLLVSGDSLMTGYWGQPEETAAAFLPVEEAGHVVRYYRTGDRVTIGADGIVQFHGRVDRQVKRRGFRIELGEIEAALACSPDVSEAAVTAQGESGATVIRAFVLLRHGVAPSTMALRAHCARILPPHVLPDEFVILETMPRGSRGKIDYEALARIGGRSE